jgi:hypothetical protein
MSGAIPPLPKYAFMAWCLVKAQGQIYVIFTDSIDQIPFCEASSHSATEEIPLLLWNSKVHYRVNNSPGNSTNVTISYLLLFFL